MPDQPAIILLNAGLVHRVGPNRIYVKVARRLASVGFLAQRFDPSGIGDSKTRADNLPLSEGVLSDTKEAMNFLAVYKGVQRFALIRICSGADNARKVAYSDARVVGAVLIEGYYVPSLGYYFHSYRKRLLNPRSWLQLITTISDFWDVLKKRSLSGRSCIRLQENRGDPA